VRGDRSPVAFWARAAGSVDSLLLRAHPGLVAADLTDHTGLDQLLARAVLDLVDQDSASSSGDLRSISSPGG